MAADNENSAAAKTAALLQGMWKRNLPVLEARLNLLDRAALGAVSGHLPSLVRKEASDIAHKLAGSLGMFGYLQATIIARELEQLLLEGTGAASERLPQLMTALRQALPL